MSVHTRVIGNESKSGKILNTYYTTKRSHHIEVGPEKIVLPGKFEQFYERIKNFEVRDDDVFILSFPKTGSRWAQEMVWLLLNNLDFKTADETSQYGRAPLLELETLFDKVVFEDHIDMINKLQSPRCIRSHLHWTLLPNAITSGLKQPKIIVVLRPPEDTCTSYFHQATVIEGYTGSWEDFCELFLDEKVPLGPYWKHVLSLWEQRHRPNVMIVKYSRMVADLAGSIRDIAAFIGKELSDDDILKMCHHLSFENLKKCKGFNMEHIVSTKDGDTNPYVRKGKVGDHKNAMSAEVIEAFKKQKAHYLSGTGLTFD